MSGSTHSNGTSAAGGGAAVVYATEGGAKVYGMMAEYATPADLTHAAEKVRDAGYTKWDVYSPFPVHGMDETMGLKKPILPLIVAVIGLSGAGLGFLFQYWVRTQGGGAELWQPLRGYATVVQGKPYDAWEPLVPVTFEIGVLFTAFTALLGMFAFNKLPMWYHPLLKKERFLKVSDDRLMICIEASDPKFDPAATKQLLETAGGHKIDLVEE